MRKAQSAIEFLAMVSLSMLLLAILYGVMANKQVETFEKSRRETAEAVADKLAFNVEMALVQGEGYSRIFSIPPSIGGVDYNFSIGNGTVVLWLPGRPVISSTLYQGHEINATVENSNVFRVKHNSSGVFLVAQ